MKDRTKGRLVLSGIVSWLVAVGLTISACWGCSGYGWRLVVAWGVIAAPLLFMLVWLVVDMLIDARRGGWL